MSFKESMRHDYPLSNKAVVFDVGGYRGEWAQIIYDRYKCEVYCFEPIFQIDNPNIMVFKFGVGVSRHSPR